MNVIRTPLTSPTIEREPGFSLVIARTPERVPQPVEEFSREQRDIDHVMRCTKVGCVRCGA